jgi:hypothetical protein
MTIETEPAWERMSSQALCRPGHSSPPSTSLGRRLPTLPEHHRFAQGQFLEEMEEPPSTLMEQRFNRRARRRASIVCVTLLSWPSWCESDPTYAPGGHHCRPAGNPSMLFPSSMSPSPTARRKYKRSSAGRLVLWGIFSRSRLSTPVTVRGMMARWPSAIFA